MYRLNDKKEAVKTVQRRLYRAPTGRFSHEDISEIERIQKKHGIKVNGAVDYPTFLAINLEFEEQKIKDIAKKHLLAKSGFPYKFGDTGRDVEIINTLLAEVMKKYGNVADLPFGLDYDGKTVKAVMMLCDIFGFNRIEYVNEVLYVRLLIECGCN